MFNAKYRTWIEVSRKNIKFNVRNVLEAVPKSVMYMGVVKGNAWGLGTVEYASTLLSIGADWIGVTLLEDAVAIRKEFKDCPILLLMEPPGQAVDVALKHGIRLTVCTMEMACRISEVAKNLDIEAKVHVKINTGLNRIGVGATDAVNLMQEIGRLPYLFLEGAYTHFSSADQNEKKSLTHHQLNLFLNTIATYESTGQARPLLHAANSPATIDDPETYLDMVRPGMSVAGLYPREDYTYKVHLRSPLTWKTIVSYVRLIRAGDVVGYGGRFACKQDTWIATIPVGTADGLGKRFENKGYVLIQGTRCLVVAVTMDQAMVAFENGLQVHLGDEVVIVGRQGSDYLGPHDISRMTSYNVEEFVCQISERIPRMYVD